MRHRLALSMLFAATLIAAAPLRAQVQPPANLPPNLPGSFDAPPDLRSLERLGSAIDPGTLTKLGGAADLDSLTKLGATLDPGALAAFGSTRNFDFPSLFHEGQKATADPAAGLGDIVLPTVASAAQQPPAQAAPPPAMPPPWLIVPQLAVTETATDNAGLTHSGREADLQTLVNPSLTVTGDTPGAKVDLNYSPVLLRNIADTSANSLDQNLFGSGVFAAVPDKIFFTSRASAFESSRGGSMGPINPVNLRSTDRTDVLAYEAGPEWRFPIDAAASGDLRYSLGETRFYDNTGALAAGAAGQPLALNPISDATQQDLRLLLDSGERGRRLTGQVSAEGTRNRFSDGGGTDDTATIRADGQFRFNPIFQFLASGGYEDLRYSAYSFADVADPIWDAGLRWQNAEDSYAQLTYGHRQGTDAFAGRLHIPVTPLTAAFADYGESITTPQQQILGNLNAAQLNPGNVVVNPQTGLPQPLAANELSLQNAIFRDRVLTAGLITVNKLDTVTLDLHYEDDVPIAGLATPDSYVGIDGRWDHAINETTRFALAAADYQRRQSSENTLMLQLSLTRAMTPSLTGSIAYEFDNDVSSVASQSYFRNAITASLQQIF